MSKLRVNAFTLSLDGYGAGPDQDLQNPLGVGGQSLHKWFVDTRTFRQLEHHLTEGAGVEPTTCAKTDSPPMPSGFQKF